jgi:hypothetical protein
VTDITRTGSREFTDEQEEAVVGHILKLTDPRRPVSVTVIAEHLRLSGRTVREIVSKNDGVLYLLAGGDEGYYVAGIADDGDGLSRRLEAQAASLLARARRRHAYAGEHLTRRQKGMF